MPKHNDAYVVFRGMKPGIYTTWEETNDQVNGFSNAYYKGYQTVQEAEDAFAAYIPEAPKQEPEAPKQEPEAQTREHMEEPAVLSADQQEVMDNIQNGNNVFMTGPGGCGKSFLVKQIYNWATSQGKRVSVCALTGCAAVLLQCKAKTLHSWSSIGLASGPDKDVVRRVLKVHHRRKNWEQVDLLIIDEVSMLSHKILSILDTIARIVRRNRAPFGGIQLLLSGDFYQLPPVGEPGDENSGKFCFENPLWEDLFCRGGVEIMLHTMFRQTNPVYVDILNNIRAGKLTKKGFRTLQSRCVPCDRTDIRPTKLLPLRRSVNSINHTEMEKLTGAVKTYKMRHKKKTSDDTASKSQVDNELKHLRNSVMVEDELVLKLGAQVMCTYNIEVEGPDSIVNGSCGVVTAFSEDGLPIVTFVNGVVRKMDFQVWASESVKGVSIQQVPLILAWALTIHKCQGASLDLVEIDVGRSIFECGQTYVALSRVRSLEGLYLSSFEPDRIRIHKKVQEYYADFE